MKKTFYLGFLILCVLFVSCDKVMAVKKSIRSVIGLENSQEVLIAEPEPTPTKDYSKEAQVITEITPQKKFYNLISGFLSSPLPEMKKLVIDEFNLNAKIFKAEDKELLSNLDKLVPLFQDENNMDALEIVVTAYSTLEGINQQGVAPLIGLGFDMHPMKTIELVYKTKKDPLCNFISVLMPSLEEEKRLSTLEARKASMNTLSKDTSLNEIIKSYINECEKTLSLEISKLSKKFSITPVNDELIPTPTITPNIIVEPTIPKEADDPIQSP